MTLPLSLRTRSEDIAAHLPALLAKADQLASTVSLGDHGRRRTGMGDAFWQYRPAQPGDEARGIDWRRSARADTNFVADKEWQIAQSVALWVDGSAAMDFRSDGTLPTKADRARQLTLATAILLARGGERVGLAGGQLPPKRGTAHLQRMAALLCEPSDGDYGTPTADGLPSQGQAIFVSDFLGDFSTTQIAVTRAVAQGITGSLLQILDPQEEAFPFDGRTEFQSMAGGIRFESLSASGLKARYIDRLAARKSALAELARQTGWQFHTHRTDRTATSALLWLYQATQGHR